jgi:hypothetical protein
MRSIVLALGMALALSIPATGVLAAPPPGGTPVTIKVERFVERDGGRATVADVAPVDVRRWLLAVQSRGSRSLAPSSMAARVRTVKAFGTWIASELDLPANPVRGVPVPRVPELLVPSLREPDILALLRTLDAGSQQPERDRAIVLLLLDTGLRLSEAASLRVCDLDLIEGRCRVLGKGGRERVVPVGRKPVVRSDIASLVGATSCPTTRCSSDEVVGRSTPEASSRSSAGSAAAPRSQPDAHLTSFGIPSPEHS